MCSHSTGNDLLTHMTTPNYKQNWVYILAKQPCFFQCISVTIEERQMCFDGQLTISAQRAEAKGSDLIIQMR